jgi:SAM-dependent methyltransferase
VTAGVDMVAGSDRRDRPRLLSYVGRWGRARRWLPDDARVVADVGCAFGYGTAALQGGARTVIGIERDPAHIREAARRFPWLRVLPGDATALPLEDASADAVVMLDVLEHLGDPRAAVVEAGRVLRTGGVIVLSVPYRGPLAFLDALNIYPILQRRFRSWEPLEPADETGPGGHRHFGLDEIRELLGPEFEIDRATRTGLGLAEVVHLALLVAFKGVLRRRGAYRALLPIHFAVYLLDDLVPTGPMGYYLTVRASSRR